MRHVGNAVPPMLARAVRDRIAEDLREFVERGNTTTVRQRRQETREERSRVMRAVPSKDTSAELLLQKALLAARRKSFQTHCSEVPGNPDVVFTRAKVVVFVDGCFWHGCAKCYREPSGNKAYWQMKVQRNRDRDKRVTAECKKAGWRVVRLWEHEVLRNANRAAEKVIKALRKKRRLAGQSKRGNAK